METGHSQSSPPWIQTPEVFTAVECVRMLAITSSPWPAVLLATPEIFTAVECVGMIAISSSPWPAVLLATPEIFTAVECVVA